jgi:hypothetical protein
MFPRERQRRGTIPARACSKRPPDEAKRNGARTFQSAKREWLAEAWPMGCRNAQSSACSSSAHSFSGLENPLSFTMQPSNPFSNKVQPGPKALGLGCLHILRAEGPFHAGWNGPSALGLCVRTLNTSGFRFGAEARSAAGCRRDLQFGFGRPFASTSLKTECSAIFGFAFGSASLRLPPPGVWRSLLRVVRSCGRDGE